MLHSVTELNVRLELEHARDLKWEIISAHRELIIREISRGVTEYKADRVLTTQRGHDHAAGMQRTRTSREHLRWI